VTFAQRVIIQQQQFPLQPIAPNQPVIDRFIDGNRLMMLRGKAFNGTVKVWLTIESQTGEHWNEVGYETARTRIFSFYPPTMREVNKGVWEIAFLEKYVPQPKPTPCP